MARMRRTYLGLSIILIVVALLTIDVPTTAAQAGDPWTLIAEVNALRASYGLAPYEVNNALTAIAQSHSEYMASTGDSPAPADQDALTTPAATVAVIMPVEVATAGADGSIIHVVAEGQALWHIAAAYEIPMPELLAQNNLTESSVIYPGDNLVVKPASQTLTPTGQATEEPEITATPTPTTKPTATPTPEPPTSLPATATAVPAALALTATPQAPAESAGSLTGATLKQPASGPDYLLIAIGGLGLAGLALVLLGGALKRRSVDE